MHKRNGILSIALNKSAICQRTDNNSAAARLASGGCEASFCHDQLEKPSVHTYFSTETPLVTNHNCKSGFEICAISLISSRFPQFSTEETPAPNQEIQKVRIGFPGHFVDRARETRPSLTMLMTPPQLRMACAAAFLSALVMSTPFTFTIWSFILPNTESLQMIQDIKLILSVGQMFCQRPNCCGCHFLGDLNLKHTLCIMYGGENHL